MNDLKFEIIEMIKILTKEQLEKLQNELKEYSPPQSVSTVENDCNNIFNLI